MVNTTDISVVKLVQSKWILGLIFVDDLPDIATDLLSKGLSSESLVKLAGLSDQDSNKAVRLFGSSFEELGFEKMSKIEALKIYAKYISSLILSSELTPKRGAELIWKAKLNANIPEFHDLDAFIYAASEIEDRPEDKAMFEGGIIEAARIYCKVQ
jgi:hypothetical protein